MLSCCANAALGEVYLRAAKRCCSVSYSNCNILSQIWRSCSVWAVQAKRGHSGHRPTSASGLFSSISYFNNVQRRVDNLRMAMTHHPFWVPGSLLIVQQLCIFTAYVCI